MIQNWMRNRNTVRFLGLWEHFHNPDFNYLEFEAIEREAGLNSFVLTPKRWVEQTRAKGIVKDYQRLKSEENNRLSLGWNLNRELTKTNYRIHTDAIKEHLIPEDISSRAQSFIYANEADVLNVALFGKTARMWRDENPDSKGNIRDEASLRELIVLVNLESMNASHPAGEKNTMMRWLPVSRKRGTECMTSVTPRTAGTGSVGPTSTKTPRIGALNSTLRDYTTRRLNVNSRPI